MHFEHISRWVGVNLTFVGYLSAFICPYASLTHTLQTISGESQVARAVVFSSGVLASGMYSTYSQFTLIHIY